MRVSGSEMYRVTAARCLSITERVESVDAPSTIRYSTKGYLCCATLAMLRLSDAPAFFVTVIMLNLITCDAPQNRRFFATGYAQTTAAPGARQHPDTY